MSDSLLLPIDLKDFLYAADTSGTAPASILFQLEALIKEFAEVSALIKEFEEVSAFRDITSSYLNPADRFFRLIDAKVGLFPGSIITFSPKTELAKRLWEIRQQIIASGEPLLTWDGLEKEIAERRSERS